jgi:hypothetical protein
MSDAKEPPCIWSSSEQSCTENNLHADQVSTELIVLCPQTSLIPELCDIIADFAEGPWSLQWKLVRQPTHAEFAVLDPYQFHHLECFFGEWFMSSNKPNVDRISTSTALTAAIKSMVEEAKSPLMNLATVLQLSDMFLLTHHCKNLQNETPSNASVCSHLPCLLMTCEQLGIVKRKDGSVSKDQLKTERQTSKNSFLAQQVLRTKKQVLKQIRSRSQ